MISLGDAVYPGWVWLVVAHTAASGARLIRLAGAVPAGELIPVPDALGLPEAAALLHDGSTALRLLEETGVQPGEHVLVTAAAGGMGVLLVQLALAACAQVIGASRGRRKLAVVSHAGAHAVVHYSEPGWNRQVLEVTAGHGPDVVFDGAGGALGRSAFAIIAGGGRFSAHGISGGGFAPLDPAEARRRGVTVHGIGAYEPAVFRGGRAALAEAAAGRSARSSGRSTRWPAQPQAHTALESRIAVAKTLLRFCRSRLPPPPAPRSSPRHRFRFVCSFGCPDPRICRQSRIHPPITAPTHPITANLLRPDLSV